MRVRDIRTDVYVQRIAELAWSNHRNVVVSAADEKPPHGSRKTRTGRVSEMFSQLFYFLDFFQINSADYSNARWTQVACRLEHLTLPDDRAIFSRLSSGKIARYT